uniref:Uncharacterized protein n=1 Tax=Avena sativa TaxID=4498 RepID=A0ACD5TS33_AVESA
MTSELTDGAACASVLKSSRASEEGAGVARRRSPLLRSQMHAGEEGARVRRRGTSPAASAPPLENDDLLGEILVRLPPQPSSLPRASAVCRRWRGLLTDAKFLRRFRVHHRKPPLLGAFANSNQGIVFVPVLDPPNRIPIQGFDLGRASDRDYRDVLDCRHGLVLLNDCGRQQVVVCDPITGEQRRVSVPPEFQSCYINGAVLCAAAGNSSPFKVVLMSMYIDINRPTVCVYTSETGIWGNLVSTEARYQLGGDTDAPATLLGNALYWLSNRDRIIEFDLDGHSLAVITGPPVTNDMRRQDHRIIRAEDGALGFAVLAFPHFQMWQRNVNCHGVATWVPWKNFEIHTILGLSSQIQEGFECLMGYSDDTDVVFLLLGYSIYMVQLKSKQFRELHETKHITRCVPFTSFYTPGTTCSMLV